jgi:hypothetical protein
MDDRHLIWRATLRPAPGLPLRLITWDLQFRENEVAVRADIDREGEMRDVDFREVRIRLNEVLLSEYLAQSVATHSERIRRSLYWQRTPDDGCCHLMPVEFDEATCSWSFSIVRSHHSLDWDLPLDGPILRPASNQMLLERREERQWAGYARQRLEWARKLSLDPDINENLLGSGQICRLRLLHYWQIPECRELFISSKSFTTLFCMPGLFQELDDTSDSSWQETVTRLARLPRQKLLERIGLPPTRQAVRLFSRITPHVIGPHLQLIRQAFANPLALKRLSDTTCAIDEMMLRLCQPVEMPVRWSLFRQLCRDRKASDFSLGGITQILDFFSNDQIGQRILRPLRKARSVEALNKAFRTANWFRGHWSGLFQPGVQDALGNLIAPLPETETIRLLNRPQDLIHLSAAHELCLDEYLHPITQGEYALYQIRHQGEFAVAGLRRTEHSPWEIDQIRNKGNAEPSQALVESVKAWHAGNTPENCFKIPPSNPPPSPS